eukprot:scaffold269888_cov17-Tisochrysis_lutea.AAC.1
MVCVHVCRHLLEHPQQISCYKSLTISISWSRVRSSANADCTPEGAAARPSQPAGGTSVARRRGSAQPQVQG